MGAARKAAAIVGAESKLARPSDAITADQRATKSGDTADAVNWGRRHNRAVAQQVDNVIALVVASGAAATQPPRQQPLTHPATAICHMYLLLVVGT